MENGEMKKEKYKEEENEKDAWNHIRLGGVVVSEVYGEAGGWLFESQCVLLFCFAFSETIIG